MALRPATVVIRRNGPNDIKVRDLYVQIDEEPERNLLFGNELEFSVEEGKHRLRVTNRLYRQEVSWLAAAGEQARFEVANVASGCGAILFVMVGMGPYRVELSKTPVRSAIPSSD